MQIYHCESLIGATTLGGMVEWSTSKRLIHAVASSIPDERFLPEVSIPPAQWQALMRRNVFRLLSEKGS